MKRISIGSDHGGFELKQLILSIEGLSFLDEGSFSNESVDYPDYAKRVCQRILSGEADMGILICGTGIGMSMAANRFHGIRAALCTTPDHAFLARSHNNANVLVLGGRTTGVKTAKACISLFFNTSFDGGRHEQRVHKIDTVSNPSTNV